MKITLACFPYRYNRDNTLTTISPFNCGAFGLNTLHKNSRFKLLTIFGMYMDVQTVKQDIIFKHMLFELSRYVGENYFRVNSFQFFYSFSFIKSAWIFLVENLFLRNIEIKRRIRSKKQVTMNAIFYIKT